MISPVLLGALALVQASPPSSDPRVRDLVYAEGAVYAVDGAFRTATQIIFGPDETVRHAAIGDSVAWEVAVEGSVVFLKPRERHSGTNLLVVTERDGTLRHYAFELPAAGQDPADADYQLRFRYPDDRRREELQRLSERRTAAERRLAELELAHGAFAGSRNLDWSAQGDSALQPAEVTDNGRFTVLRFARGQALPALFEVGDDGSERLVPYDVRGEWVVIHGVPRALRLRRGRAVLCLFNDGAAVPAPGPDTGTASNEVHREPVGARP